ncbi:mucin-2-like [Neocloeon triangulifer]|uniref:mucin-2-like n=1 Tax=Neocloeon triangulifer TaxID=2078957 RepID=UPI00286F0206|nr:mucin-2-like [Neocloeon triangulifer]
MKYILLGLVLLATYASSEDPTGCETVSCPLLNGEFAEHKPHPFRCDSFCKCDWGKAVYFACPDGLHFNAEKEVCDWPEAAGCADGGVTEDPDCDLPTEGPGVIPPSNGCKNVTCPEDSNSGLAIHLPNPDDCGSFCKCDWGVPIYFDCPGGLHFNPKLEVCDWPENAGCGGGNNNDTGTGPINGCEYARCPPTNTNPLTNLKNPDDCGSYCQCYNGVPNWVPCSPDLHFNPAHQICEHPLNAGCDLTTTTRSPNPTTTTRAPNPTTTTRAPNPTTTTRPSNPTTTRPSVTTTTTRRPSSDGCTRNVQCPNNNNEGPAIHYPNPEDCSSYCVCNWGNPILMQCPPGLHFNPVAEVCDWPQSAGCDGTVEPPPGIGGDDGDNCRTVRCPGTCGPINLPNPGWCNSFCRCANGTSSFYPCPPDLVFNPSLGICDYSDCENRDDFNTTTSYPIESTTTTPITITTKPPTNTTNTPITTKPPTNTTNTPITTKPPNNTTPSRPICPNVTCPETNGEFVLHLPNPGDCGSFCKCDWGTGYYFDCPDGLHFNAQLQVCDWPENAGCQEGSDPIVTTPPSGGSTPGGGASTTTTPSSGGSTPGGGNTTPARPICPNVQCPEINGEFALHLPNPGDCGSFCKCDWGTGYYFDCPDGLHFNAQLQVCDWPQYAGCDGPALTTSSPNADFPADPMPYRR